MQEIISKVRSRVIFLDPSEQSLNVYFNDMGEEQVTVSPEGNSVEPLPVSYGVVQSPNVYVQATVTIPISKTRPVYDTYKNRAERNGVINGRVEVTDDAGKVWKLYNCALQLPKNLTTNGSEPFTVFEIIGSIEVNTDLTKLFF